MGRLSESIVAGVLSMSLFFSLWISYAWLFAGGSVTFYEPNRAVRLVEAVLLFPASVYSVFYWFRRVFRDC